MLAPCDSNQANFYALKHKKLTLTLYVVHFRRLRDEVEAKNIEKQRLMKLKGKDRTEIYLTRDKLSTLPSNFAIDIPCFSIPQLKVICQIYR